MTLYLYRASVITVALVVGFLMGLAGAPGTPRLPPPLRYHVVNADSMPLLLDSNDLGSSIGRARLVHGTVTHVADGLVLFQWAP